MRHVLTVGLLALAVPAGAQTLIVGNKGEDTVSFIDLKSGRQRAKMATGSMPHEVAVSPDGRRAVLLERIDLGANRRLHGLVWLPDGRLVATTEGSDTLTVVSARGAADGVSAIPTGQRGSHMVAVDRGRTAYVANMGSGSVGIIDLAARTATRNVPVGAEPEGIALSPDGLRLWVADRKGAAVHVFDTATMKRVATLATGAMPIRVAVSPDGQTAAVSNYGSGTLSLFDTKALKATRTLRVSGDPARQQVTILFSRDGRRLYVAETGIDRVAEVDIGSGRILRRLPAGRMGDGLAISAVTVRRR